MQAINRAIDLYSSAKDALRLYVYGNAINFIMESLSNEYRRSLIKFYSDIGQEIGDRFLDYVESSITEDDLIEAISAYYDVLDDKVVDLMISKASAVAMCKVVYTDIDKVEFLSQYPIDASLLSWLLGRLDWKEKLPVEWNSAIGEPTFDPPDHIHEQRILLGVQH